MKLSRLLLPLLVIAVGSAHAATVFSIFDNVQNGTASGGSGSGVGA